MSHPIIKILLLGGLVIFLSCEKEAPEETVLTDPTIEVREIPNIITQGAREVVLFMARVRDPQGLDDVKQVSIELRQQGQIIESGLMWDDGENGDIIARNGTYTYAVIPARVSFIPGDLVVAFHAEDREGHTSQEVSDTLSVQTAGANDPPQILEVAGPTTISRSRGGWYLLTATVTDPQGLDDIQRVYFNSFRPDGSAATGNPFLMYDTGTQGDIQAGDGIYSFQFTISATNQLGEYRFEVQAEDKAGARSNVMIHKITVIE